MQNLTKCTNGHFTIPRNTVLSSFSKALRDGYFSRNGCPHIVQPRRMFHPLSYHAYKHLQREFKAIRAILIRSQSDLTQYYDHLLKSRNFSSSSPQSSRGGDRGQPSSSDDPSNDDPKNNKDRDKLIMMVTKLLLFCALVSIFFTAISKFIYGDNTPEQQRFVSWNEFAHHMLAKGEVEQLLVRPDLSLVTIVLYDGAVFKGRRSDFKVYFMTVPDLDLFEEKLRETERKLGIKPEGGVPIIYRRKGSFGTMLLPLAISLFILSKVMGKSGGFRGSFPMDLFSQMRRAKYTLIDPLTGTGKGVRFEDVAGLHEAKIEIMEFVDYLKRPEHYKVLGAKVPKGALLLGPPGCGKTLLAKAVATEAKVPFLSMNGSEFVEMIGGLGAARVRDLFTEGKKRAPSIIFIDEIDAIGGKRSESGVDKAASELEQTLNQLLVELDGMASREGVIVLASTNRAEVLDKALLRPGRFDRQILIDLPTLEERRQIFERHLKNIVLDDKPEAYSDRLARLSPGFSGADIANVCNEAALHAARVKKKKVDASDLSGAIDRVIGGLEKKDHAISPAEKKVVAYHESGHALTGWLLKHTDALLKITIVPRTNSVLGFAQYAPTDQKLHSKDELFEKMCMTLGGRVAESLIFNKISTGAQNDLTKVTKMAYDQVQRFGMSRNVGLLSFDENQTGTNTRKPYSKHLGNLIDIEARRMVGEAYRKTQELLSNNREKLELLAEELLAKETLSYEDIEKLIGPPPFGKKRLIAPATFEQTIRGKEESTPQPTST